MPSFKSFADMSAHLKEESPDLFFVECRFGAFYHVPAADSDFGLDRRAGVGGPRPWVVTQPDAHRNPTVSACPRTTQEQYGADTFRTDAGVVPRLDREGWVLFKYRRPYAVEAFREYAHVGDLPDIYKEQLRLALARYAAKVQSFSEGP